MALTSDQLSDIRMDLQIGVGEDVFTNVQLNRFFTRAGNDYNLAVYYAWRAILADTAKFVDYQLAHTRMSKSQIFDHVRDMVGFWQTEARSAANQVKVAGARRIPHQPKDRPGSLLRRTRKQLNSGVW